MGDSVVLEVDGHTAHLAPDDGAHATQSPKGFNRSLSAFATDGLRITFKVS